MERPAFFLLALGCILTLSACAPYKLGDRKAAVCNELNSQIIFNGSTSNRRLADIQNAQTPLAQQNYDRDGCDQ